jgi:hypothetical protein
LQAKRGGELIGGPDQTIDGLQVTLDGRDVPYLAGTSLFFWNAGNQTLDGSALVPADALRIECPQDVQILRTHLTTTRPVNGIALEPIDTADPVTKVTVGFEFLDPGDGFRVDVMHTGIWRDVVLRGTLKGHPGGIKEVRPVRELTGSSKFRSRVGRAIRQAGFVVGVVAISAAALIRDGVLLSDPVTDPPSPLMIRAFLLFFGTMYVLPQIGHWLRQRRPKPPPELLPEEWSLDLK